jgi:sugar phosphate permease
MTELPFDAQNPTFKRWRIRVFSVTWMSYAGFYFCRKTFGIVKPELKSTYHFSDMELAHIWTAYLVAYMLGQFLAAKLGRRFACRILLMVGMGVSLLANVGLGVVITGGLEAFWALIALMVINGFAQATGWPGNVGILAKWTQHSERGRVMAWWGTCYQIGSVFAKHFAAIMLATMGLAWSFWGASVVLLGVWVVFYFWGHEEPESLGLPAMVEEIEVQAEAVDGSQQDRVPPWSEAIRIVVAMGGLYFCFKFLRYALDSWSPMLLQESFPELDVATAGHLSTAFDWVGFLGVIAAGYLSDKVFRSYRTPVIFWMTVGTLLATFLLYVVGGSSLILFVILLGLVGFMMMGPDSLLSGTAAMDVSTKEMAVVVTGIINGLGSIGPVVQELVIGYIKTTYGAEAVFLLLVGIAALAVVGTGALWIYARHHKLAL